MGKKVYFNNDERMVAINKSKYKYMFNKEWHCEVCIKNQKNYTLAGKWSHIKIQKQQFFNCLIINIIGKFRYRLFFQNIGV